MVLNNYHYILLNCKLALQHQFIFSLSTCLLFISIIQSGSSAKFLNIVCLLFISAALAAALAPLSTALKVPVTKTYASL